MFILYHRNGGWFTTSAILHSDYRRAATFTEDEVRDIVKLHEGRLMPVNKELYESIMKGTKA